MLSLQRESELHSVRVDPSGIVTQLSWLFLRLLQELFPRSAELYERVAANREQWAKVSNKFTIRGLPSNNSLDFLDEEFELLQSQGAFGDDSHRMNGCLDDECDKHDQ